MPRKVFTGGSILQAAEVNTFLMDQAVMTFDDAAARDAAIPSPVQGMVTFLKDLNVLEAWFGDRWGQVSGAGAIFVSETAPTGPDVEDGSLWFNSVLGRTFIYYEDEDSDQWVEIGAGSGPTAAAVFTSAPASAELGQLWFDAETGNMYFYYVDNDSAQWIQVRSAAPAFFDATPTVAGVVKGTTSDAQNTALGDLAFTSNTTGNNNVALGVQALQNNTTGDNNIGIGRAPLLENTTGDDNVAVGRVALRDNTTGNNNTAVGRTALQNNTTGNNNVALGQTAGSGLTTGSNNIILGRNAQASTATVSNQITLGDANITSLRCNVTTISSLSDVRDKTDIETTEYGLEFINKLRPVEFAWDRRDGTMEGKTDIGFVAQELAELEDEYDDAERLRLTLRDNPEKLEAAPGRLIPILVKAIQDLSARIDELEAK